MYRKNCELQVNRILGTTSSAGQSQYNFVSKLFYFVKIKIPAPKTPQSKEHGVYVVVSSNVIHTNYFKISFDSLCIGLLITWFSDGLRSSPLSQGGGSEQTTLNHLKIRLVFWQMKLHSFTLRSLIWETFGSKIFNFNLKNNLTIWLDPDTRHTNDALVWLVCAAAEAVSSTGLLQLSLLPRQSLLMLILPTIRKENVWVT